MASPFYEIFREFETDAESKNILGNAVVEKVSTNSTKDKMRIYLRFETLIPKRRIWKDKTGVCQKIHLSDYTDSMYAMIFVAVKKA